MNWNLCLMLFMFFVLITEWVKWKKQGIRRDFIAFISLWILTMGVLLSDWWGYPVRPLDWIRAATEPLNGWLG